MKTGEEEGEGEASEEKMRLNIKKKERDWQSYVHDHAEPPASILNSPHSLLSWSQLFPPLNLPIIEHLLRAGHCVKLFHGLSHLKLNNTPGDKNYSYSHFKMTLKCSEFNRSLVRSSTA